jgi:hypothetical protein
MKKIEANQQSYHQSKSESRALRKTGAPNGRFGAIGLWRGAKPTLGGMFLLAVLALNPAFVRAAATNVTEGPDAKPTMDERIRNGAHDEVAINKGLN